jgi:kinesin family protein 1
LNGKVCTPDESYKLRSGFRIILGDHHVFRFNNPEEVRKQRDKQRAATLPVNMNGDTDDPSTTGTPITRPDSPISTVADVDWNFAKREAALRLAGLDPDNMPDQELDQLYERITKVKTLREHRFKPRPDSSMSLSQLDDVWSEMGRPLAGSSEILTDDTSLLDGGGTHEEQMKEMQGQLEAQRAEFESRLQSIGEGTEAEDLKVEKEHMQHQLTLVQAQMMRLLEMRSRGAIDEHVEVFEPVIYTAKQLRLIRKVLDKWRAHRSFSMAETVLSSAVLVKEANILRYVVDQCPFLVG